MPGQFTDLSKMLGLQQCKQRFVFFFIYLENVYAAAPGNLPEAAYRIAHNKTIKHRESSI